MNLQLSEHKPSQVKQKVQIVGQGQLQQQNIQQQFSDTEAQRAMINPLKVNANLKTYLSFPTILLRILNLCFSSFYFGYTLGYLGSYDFKSIIQLYNITQNVQLYQGILQSIVSFGAAAGAMSAGLMFKSFSRRNFVLVVNVAAFIFGILVLFPNLYLFIIARFFQGMCVGLYSAVIPVLIKQFAPTQLSGTFGALNQTFIAFGVFFAFAFQLLLLEINQQIKHWRIQHGLTLITIAIQTVLLLTVYKQQTPKYYLLQHQQQQCIKLLKKIYKPELIKFILRQKKSDLGMGIKKKDTEGQQSSPNIELDENQKKGRKLRIFTAIDLAVLQQFVGINAVVSYGVQIVAKVLPNLGKIIPVILNFQGLVFGLISTFVLGRVGRVFLLQSGTIIASMSLVFVGIGFILNDNTGNILILVGLFIFMGNFGMTLGPVFWLYVAEIVQPQIIPYTTLTNWGSSTIVIMLFPILSTAFGTPVPLFFFFAGWSFIFFFINSRILVQTKDKTQKQIRQQFKEK